MRKLNWKLPPTYHLSVHKGNACILEPPGHPRYFTRSVYTQYGNSPPDRIGVTYEYNGMFFSDIEDVDKYFKPLPLEHERTQHWIADLFQYFHNCYSDPTKPSNVNKNTIIYPVPDYQLKHFVDDPRFSEEWRTKERASIDQANIEIIQNAQRLAILDNHQAVRFIRKYYPYFIPTWDMTEPHPELNTGNWWERLETRPTPDNCPGEDWHKHPVNTTWCQVCGWHSDSSN